MKKFAAVLASLALAVMALAGCNGNGDSSKSDVGEAKYGDTYPIKCETELTYWMPMSAVISKSASNFGELPIAKEIEKRTGIKVKYEHPSLTNAKEKFNLMIASGELPDIIQYGWAEYAGGPAKAIDDGVIIPLNDYIDAFAPDLKKLYEENPDIAKEAKTDAGQYYAAGTIVTDPKLLTSGGLIIRDDWLNELGLEMPETIDEWYTVLKAFKEKKGAKAPMVAGMDAFTVGAFTGAYGINWGLYRDGNTIKYGAAEKNYKKFLETIHKWYDEGLFDNNFSTTDSATKTANMLNGVSGVTYGGLGGGIGALMSAAKEPGFSVTGAPYPTHKKGEKPKFGYATSPYSAATAITTACKDKEAAMRLLNYGYTKEGHILYNFGTEGVSYTMKDGIPTYTELVTKNPDGLSMSEALVKYCFGGQRINAVQNVHYLEQYASLPQQQAAWDRWIDTDGQKHRIPATYIDSSKSSEYQTKFADVDAYAREMFVKFVSGDEPISNFDNYIKQLKKIGLDDVIKMNQEAYDKFLKR